MDQNSPHVGVGAADVTELQRLEESLWRAETRFDNSYMDAVLAGDFTEFGRYGRTYSRLDILGATGQEINSRHPWQVYSQANRYRHAAGNLCQRSHL